MYDNLYPSRIIVGTDMDDARLVEAAHTFAGLLQQGAIKENIDTLFMGFTRSRSSQAVRQHLSCSPRVLFQRTDTYAELKGLDTQQIIDRRMLGSADRNAL